jgi:cell wall-associated NlpC family hydrolase
MTDYRMTPSNGRVAHISLRGKVAADRYVTGEPARVTTQLADLLVRPDGPRDRQVLHGDRVLVLERLARHAFVQVEKDGFCGYLLLDTLGRDGPVTHWVSAPATHLYATPTIKRREIGCLTMGSRLQVVAEEAAFLVTADGAFVPRQHLSPVGSFLTDPVAVAETFLGTPYLWGGNSRWGIDCSGLVQAALLACGIACPGDSDLQWEALGTPIGSDQPHRRGDLMFWEGHVAVVADQGRILHANGHRMAVTYEGRQDALDRIAASGTEGFLGTRRL